MNCPICNRPDEGNPGDYYHRKDCQAKDLQRRIAAGEKGLERELEAARYVGD